ncbi:MAG: alanine--tRNA ligase [Candidatus Bathyarchaeota archaeon]|nr:alanine--tRNA ligase [Candidatus Bathyarchaeota archaeon]MDH5732596.1 alanine--tRNA ligase [Candidatus Bathyarchaeota archaeon]
MKRFPKTEYHVPFFDEVGYVRKLCPTCGVYFWTQHPDQKSCGEATSEGCATQTFIGNPPTRKSYRFREMREAFLSFFEKYDHKRIKPYPVVARWRDDLYFTSASIVDFQPYVTNGIVPPPANPLVISQPCIRFVDVDNVGPTFGRHLTVFEMGGHHAFNYPDKAVYWKDQTVRYHHEFVVKELGVKSEEVIYKEDVWSGGGNAGPDLETIVRGLELATLVFMKFKVINNEFVELPIRTVDTGYGIERYTWLSQGALSGFHAIYGTILDEIMKMAGMSRADDKLLAKVSEVSGLMSLKKTVSPLTARKKIAKYVEMNLDELDKVLVPAENAFAIADHTKCLVFMLAEGVVPSNVREGYLTRLMIRRTYRLLRNLTIEDKMFDIVNMQISHWSKDFPHLKEMQDEILEILSVEQDKFKETLKRGRSLINRRLDELWNPTVSVQEEISSEMLVELYDSHGLPPEFVQGIAEDRGFPVRMPENFYMMVAERHVQAPQVQEEEKIKGLEALVSDLPETRMLYYEDSYISEFEAQVLRILKGQYVVLDKTAFYPEGGGQPADHGRLEFNGKRLEIMDVQKIGNVIVHVVKNASALKSGNIVKGSIDWEKRSSLMKQHTATHVVNGAARRVLGQHVWQAGAQKDIDKARLDISHFQRLTLEEVHKIEQLANQAVIKHIPVETSWVPRIDAEKQYGFRLYQGGVVPGKEIRVVKTGDWEVEACGGTHLKNTGEIGFIKILHTERIQDGVERIVFSAGIPALKAVQKEEALLWKVSELINAPLEKVEATTKRLVREWKEARRERKRLIKELAAGHEGIQAGVKREGEQIGEVKFEWLEFEKLDVDRMIETAREITSVSPDTITVCSGVDGKTARIVVMAGKDALDVGINSAEISGVVASVLGGGGSGRPDFAQGGGTLVDNLSEARKKAEEIVKKQLQR